MSVIGIELGMDELVLTRGRDFQWYFDNLDDQEPPQPTLFPNGELYLELLTKGEHNALQEVSVTAASGGFYKLIHDGNETANIDFNDVTNAPHGGLGDITDALEALPSIGPGNVVVHPAQVVPVWELTLTMNTGVNEKQQITFTGNPTGGNFKLGYGLEFTTIIPFKAPPADVKAALEALPSIGVGNVKVVAIPNNGYEVEFIGTKAQTNVGQILGYGTDFFTFSLTGGFFPNVQTSTMVNGSAKFSEQFVNMLNKTVNDVFNSFESMFGVDIDYVVTDNQNTTLKVTGLKSYQESDISMFSVDVTSTLIEGALNSVSTFFNMFSTVHVDFYWNRTYQVEFVGALENTPQDKLGVNKSGLTGLNSNQNVEVTVLEVGKERKTKWPFNITGSRASLKIESEVADTIPARTKWQLVFLPAGEPAGGEPVGLGRVETQGES